MLPQVLKAIKAREDAVEKLHTCCEKLESCAAGSQGMQHVLSTDPLVQLFFR